MVVALGAKDSSAYFSNEVIPKTEYRWGWAIDGRFVRDPGADRSKGHQYLIFSPAVNDYFVVEVSDPKFLDEIDGFQIAAVQTADE